MIGLFFGSFNPIHKGHIAIARYLLQQGYCQTVRFVVSPRNPFKHQVELLDEEKRLQIVKSSIAHEKDMTASDIEFDMPRPSYTIDTLRRLFALEPAHRFALIIGGDNVEGFSRWKNFEEILASCKIWVYPRPGYDTASFPFPAMTAVNAPLSPVSSTQIRALIHSGKSIHGLVAEQAESLITDLYTQKL